MVREMTSEQVEISVLNTRRKQRLEWYEAEIEKRGKGLANIFKELRDDKDKPWLLTHPTFEQYCRERWNMTPRRTQQIIAAENVRALLIEEVPEEAEHIQNLGERPLRELVTTPPLLRQNVLRTALAIPGVTTAAKLKIVKSRMIEPTEPIAAEVCPTCGKKL